MLPEIRSRSNTLVRALFFLCIVNFHLDIPGQIDSSQGEVSKAVKSYKHELQNWKLPVALLYLLNSYLFL